MLADFQLSKLLLGVTVSIFAQRIVFRLITLVLLTREFDHNLANEAWWSGKWSRLGWIGLVHWMREYLCKIVELCMFAVDLWLGHLIHFLLFPLCLIPWIDRAHTIMLLWMTPKTVKIKNGRSFIKAGQFFSLRA